MSTTLTYPGVYIEELSSGVHTVTGVATSITAFVGYTSRGLDNRATRILSFSDFERAFGGLAADSELSYAVQQFYANGGGEAFVVRIPRKGSTPATTTLLDSGGKKALKLTALSKGTWANGLLIDVDYDGFPATDTDSYHLTLTDSSTGTVEKFVVSQNSAKPNFVTTILNDSDRGSKLVSASIADSTSARPAVNGTVGGDIALDKIAAPLRIKISSDVPSSGTTITDLDVTLFDSGEVVPTSLSYLGLARLVERKINLALAGRLSGASVRCHLSSSGKGLRIVATFDQSLLPSTGDAVLSFSGAEAALLKLDSVIENSSHYVLGTGRISSGHSQSDVASGSDGSGLPETADIIGNSGAKPPTGIYALERVDLFNLLCIPDATRASTSDPNQLASGINSTAIYSAALALCKKRRAFLLVDPPPYVVDVDAAADWKSNSLSALADPNAAAYFPRLRLADPLDDYNLRTFAPSGVIAGLYSRIDADRGVWKAPAGTEATLTGVTGPVYPLNDGENGILNPLGLNCLRTFPVYGNVSWGARTLAGADVVASDWKYIPVRRLALFLEESLFRGTKWAVFEPNDESLWAQLRLNLGAFMNNLYRQGAFAGRSAREAYLVKCDRETTTQDDVNRGVVNVLVGFAPLKPAEFVVIRIQQMAGQIST